MWDVRQREFIANQLAVGFDFFGETHAPGRKFNINNVQNPSNRQLRPIFRLHDLIQRITPKVQTGYRDDITAIITKL
jgi:hypothetical protein